MSTTTAELLPLLGLRITAGPLELRGIGDDDLAALLDLAATGIHPPDRMPFYVPWTDVPAEDLPRSFAAYHWGQRAAFSVDSWSADFAVRYDGALVGTQGISAKAYPVTRTGETGSWLAAAHQGRGIGTLMRQVLCAFMFDHLEAEEVTSAAFLDNPASLAVSRKVGYRPGGVRRLQRRPGELALNQQLALAPADLVRAPYPLRIEGLPAFRRSIGLDVPLT